MGEGERGGGSATGTMDYDGEFIIPLICSIDCSCVLLPFFYPECVARAKFGHFKDFTSFPFSLR